MAKGIDILYYIKFNLHMNVINIKITGCGFVTIVHFYKTI